MDESDFLCYACVKLNCLYIEILYNLSLLHLHASNRKVAHPSKITNRLNYV